MTDVMHVEVRGIESNSNYGNQAIELEWIRLYQKLVQSLHTTNDAYMDAIVLTGKMSDTNENAPIESLYFREIHKRRLDFQKYFGNLLMVTMCYVFI